MGKPLQILIAITCVAVLAWICYPIVTNLYVAWAEQRSEQDRQQAIADMRPGCLAALNEVTALPFFDPKRPPLWEKVHLCENVGAITDTDYLSLPVGGG